MSRKGRCSNLPNNCEMAKNATLLPFAGIGSICPECGAPLAAVNTNNEPSETIFSDPQDEFRARPQRRYQSERSPKSQNTLLNAGLIAAFIVGLGLLAFIATKMMRNNESTDSVSEIVSGAPFDPTQVAAIEPSIIARASSNLDVKAEPSSNAQSVGSLGIGSVVDVTGRVNIKNTIWVRINVPNQPNRNGYVPEDQLLNLSGAPIGIGGPNDLTTNNIAPSQNVPAPPVLSDIVETPEKTVYIQSNRANIRAEAGPEAARIGEGLRGDTFSINASRTNNGKTWYRITLPNGSQGWISASLVGNSPPAPLPEPTEPAEKSDAPTAAAPKEIAAGSRVVITGTNVSVHSAASPEDETKIANAERGNVLQVIEVTQSGGQTWYKVKSNRFGIDGWIPASAAKQVE